MQILSNDRTKLLPNVLLYVLWFTLLVTFLFHQCSIYLISAIIGTHHLVGGRAGSPDDFAARAGQEGHWERHVRLVRVYVICV